VSVFGRRQRCLPLSQKLNQQPINPKLTVAIKVDREERPDIDNVYMTVTQALTGSGGWPMTIFLTPDKKPFYAGTYFPKHQRWGRPGLMELLPKIAEAWQNDRQKILTSADQITQHIVRLGIQQPGISYCAPPIPIITRTFADRRKENILYYEL